MQVNIIYVGDNIESLKQMEDCSVDCCVTSPPYYGLRDYGTAKWVGGDINCPHKRMSKHSDKTATGHKQEELRGNVGDAIYKTVCPLCGAVREDLQVGLEETPDEYIERLVNIFREVKRVLKDDGTLWLNIGDTYNSSTDETNNCKPKDLIGIPWLLAFALRNDGWYLRQDIIWHKPNPMPESVKDRCTKSHEYIFLLTKSSKYYFDSDAIQEQAKEESEKRYGYEFNNGKEQENFRPDGASNTAGMKNWTGMRNKRDVWSVNVASFSGAHFATFPEELIEPMILAGCPINGTVLDPFMGSGTVGIVAKRNNRNYVGCELNESYAEMAKRRIGNTVESLF